MALHRYWRVLFQSNTNATSDVYVARLWFYDQTGTNLLNIPTDGTPVSVYGKYSSTPVNSAYSMTAALDNDPNTAFWSNTGIAMGWDCGVPVSIDKITVQSPNSGNLILFSRGGNVQWSDDGTNWYYDWQWRDQASSIVASTNYTYVADRSLNPVLIAWPADTFEVYARTGSEYAISKRLADRGGKWMDFPNVSDTSYNMFIPSWISAGNIMVRGSTASTNGVYGRAYNALRPPDVDGYVTATIAPALHQYNNYTCGIGARINPNTDTGYWFYYEARTFKLIRRYNGTDTLVASLASPKTIADWQTIPIQMKLVGKTITCSANVGSGMTQLFSYTDNSAQAITAAGYVGMIGQADGYVTEMASMPLVFPATGYALGIAGGGAQGKAVRRFTATLFGSTTLSGAGSQVLAARGRSTGAAGGAMLGFKAVLAEAPGSASGKSNVVAFGSTPIAELSDTFTAPQDIALEQHMPELGGAWRKVSGSGIGVVGGQAVAAGSGTQFYLNTLNPDSADYTVLTGFSKGTGSALGGVVARMSDDGKTGYQAYYQDGTVYLVRLVNGNATTLYSEAVSISTTETVTLGLTTKGTVTSLIWRGRPIIDVNDIEIRQVGRPGIIVAGSGALTQVTSFRERETTETVGKASGGVVIAGTGSRVMGARYEITREQAKGNANAEGIGIETKTGAGKAEGKAIALVQPMYTATGRGQASGTSSGLFRDSFVTGVGAATGAAIVLGGEIGVRVGVAKAEGKSSAYNTSASPAFFQNGGKSSAEGVGGFVQEAAFSVVVQAQTVWISSALVLSDAVAAGVATSRIRTTVVQASRFNEAGVAVAAGAGRVTQRTIGKATGTSEATAIGGGNVAIGFSEAKAVGSAICDTTGTADGITTNVAAIGVAITQAPYIGEGAADVAAVGAALATGVATSEGTTELAWTGAGYVSPKITGDASFPALSTHIEARLPQIGASHGTSTVSAEGFAISTSTGSDAGVSDATAEGNASAEARYLVSITTDVAGQGLSYVAGVGVSFNDSHAAAVGDGFLAPRLTGKSIFPRFITAAEGKTPLVVKAASSFAPLSTSAWLTSARGQAELRGHVSFPKLGGTGAIVQRSEIGGDIAFGAFGSQVEVLSNLKAQSAAGFPAARITAQAKLQSSAQIAGSFSRPATAAEVASGNPLKVRAVFPKLGTQLAAVEETRIKLRAGFPLLRSNGRITVTQPPPAYEPGQETLVRRNFVFGFGFRAAGVLTNSQ